MKIPKKKILVQKKDKIDIKKYKARPSQLNSRALTNFNTSEFKSDLSSPIHSILNSSNAIPKPKFTYLLTSNESLNLKTETNNNYYPKKYLDSFNLLSRNKNNYSEKIKTYRKNLDEIVNKLNDTNKKYRKIINKENINLITHSNYDEYFIQTPKDISNKNKRQLNNNFNTFTYNQRYKNNVIKNYGERTEIRNNPKYLYTDINNYNKKTNLTVNNLYEMDKENNNNIANINKLRNEFNKISSNYLEVSQRIDTLNNSERDNNDISYEEIIKNNSKLNDILSYNYKTNNDSENEKVFILMKLRLKNAQIMINKLENENKKYLSNNNKYKILSDLNKKLEIENKNLKIEKEKLNININLIKKEFDEYQNEKNNLNNKNIIKNENNDLQKDKGKIKVNNKENKIKELKEKSNKISKENKNLKILLKDLQSKYRILQDIHLELKQKYNENNNNEIKSLKNEIDNLNNKCLNYEKRISELNKLETKTINLKNANRNLIKEKNKIENKCKEITNNKEENKKIKPKELFCDFYKKYAKDKLKENKIKMLIGIYLQKQSINFNKIIKEYKDKNKKLVKSVRKLNEQIVEFKLNKLNNSDKK